MTQARVVVALSDNARVDLDWLLPLIDEVAADGGAVDVFDLTVHPGQDHSSIRLLRSITGRWPWRYPDIEPIPIVVARWLDRLRANRRVAIARMGALYFSPRTPLRWLLPLPAWRTRRRRERLDRLFAGATCLFVGVRPRDWSADSGEGELIAAARHNNVPVVGYPPVVDHEIVFPSLMQCDVALANTSTQAKRWQAVSDLRVVAVTPPPFTQRWLRRVNELVQHVQMPPQASTNRKTTLVILKNDNSVVWNGLDFHATASELLKTLLATGYDLLIKPHPRQSQIALTRLLAPIDAYRYQLVEGPLMYWAQRADVVVSLFSGGVLDCLAVGRVAVLYWPMTEEYKVKIRGGAVTDTYVRADPDGQLHTKYSELCVEVTTPEFVMPNTSEISETLLMRFRALYPESADCTHLLEQVRRTDDGRGHRLDAAACALT